jgi:hypothetical protein
MEDNRLTRYDRLLRLYVLVTPLTRKNSSTRGCKIIIKITLPLGIGHNTHALVTELDDYTTERIGTLIEDLNKHIYESLFKLIYSFSLVAEVNFSFGPGG